MDVDSMNALHNELWSSPMSRLAEWWQLALEHYNVIAPVPETAFSPKPGTNERNSGSIKQSVGAA